MQIILIDLRYSISRRRGTSPPALVRKQQEDRRPTHEDPEGSHASDAISRNSVKSW